MIENLTLSLVEAIKTNGSLSVFIGGVIEQLLGVLIPSPLVPMSAGFLLIPKEVAFMPALMLIIKKISLPYCLGASLGAMVLYLIAFSGGRLLIDKFGRFLGISLNNIDKFRKKFTRGFKDEALIFLLLIIPVSPVSLIAASCAIIGIKAWEFLPILLAGTFFRSLFLAFLGWKVGETYQLALKSLDKTETYLSISIIGIVFLVITFLYYKREKFFNNA